MAKGQTFQIGEAWKQPRKKAADAGPARSIVANNKKARHDYSIEDVFEAGIVLSGTEVKALRMGRASLTDGFVPVRSGRLAVQALGKHHRHSPLHGDPI